MAHVAVYPGSFDPLTFGHLEVVERGCAIFDEIIVAVAGNAEKHPIFSAKERYEMAKAILAGKPGVRVDRFAGATVDYVRRQGARVILRGLRSLSDFDYELSMALMNRQIAPEVETVFVAASPGTTYISSRLVKEAAAAGQDLSPFVPPPVAEALRRKLGRT